MLEYFYLPCCGTDSLVVCQVRKMWIMSFCFVVSVLFLAYCAKLYFPFNILPVCSVMSQIKRLHPKVQMT